MLLLEILSPKEITSEPKDELWFKHTTSEKLNVIKPQSYNQLRKIRGDEYPITNRQEEEKEYHKLTKSSDKTSFVYASIVGNNKFPSPKKFPGYTYYFKLSDKQIEKCVFDIVGSKDKLMKPTLGKKGLNKAMKLWSEHSAKLKTYKEKGVGEIFPRIEVIIPFNVKPDLYIPQEEDRKKIS